MWGSCTFLVMGSWFYLANESVVEVINKQTSNAKYLPVPVRQLVRCLVNYILQGSTRSEET